MKHWASSSECFQHLKNDKGYRIAVTSLQEESIDIFDLDMQTPTAIVFGNEMAGVSQEVCDCLLVSVCVGVRAFVCVRVCVCLSPLSRPLSVLLFAHCSWGFSLSGD